MINKTEPDEQNSNEQEQASITCTVIAHGTHPITPGMLDSDALFVLEKLQKAGFSGYLVGGGVRDLYLGKKPKDFDISTNARPGQIRKLFRNSRTIGRRFRLVQVFFKRNKTIEVSTLRSLSEHDLDGPEAVLAPNNTYGTLDEDAQRRDLTINSLFYEIENHSILDYVGGVDDLENGLVRMVGTPDKRITRDPVRMMRAIRHSARNNFKIEKNTWKAICENSDKLSLCPPSRLRDELLKDLYNTKAEPWFNLAVKAGIFETLVKEYKDILSEPFLETQTCKEQLQKITAVIDQMNSVALKKGVSRQPDFFLLGLMLIPWAEVKFSLLSKQRKGSAAFHLGKEIRMAIDQGLGTALNLRKSLRQEITTLLINLPLFIMNSNGKDWPKWLKKKSYFEKCLLFYNQYQKSIAPIPQKEIEPPTENPTTPPIKETTKPVKRQKNGAKGKGVAFSTRKGGIFGFRKE